MPTEKKIRFRAPCHVAHHDVCTSSWGDSWPLLAKLARPLREYFLVVKGMAKAGYLQIKCIADDSNVAQFFV